MRFHLVLLGAAAFLPTPLLRADVTAPAVDKDLAEAIDEVNYVETAQKGIVLSGYVDAGYTYNFANRSEALPFRAFTADATPGGHFDLYSAKVVLEKPLTEANEWQAGFRADLMFGEDAGDLGGNAAGTDSLYLQQAFVQFRVPVGNGLDFVVGKYAAVVGYESEDRPDNINITAGMSSIADPSWQVGVLSTYAFNETVDVGLGVNNGNTVDTFTIAGVNHSADPIALTGYINVNSEAKNANIQLGGFYSFNGDPNVPPVPPAVTMRQTDTRIANLFGNWSPKFAKDKLLLAFNSSIVNLEDNGTVPSGDNSSTYSTVALYAKYLLTDLVSVGGRLEYVHLDDAGMFTGGPSLGGTDLWGWTGTLGFNLAENLMVRAEYRIDFGDDVRVNATTGAQTHDTAQTVAADVVFSF